MHYVNNSMDLPATSPPGAAGRVLHLVRRAVRGLDGLSPLVDLALRLFVAAVFFNSGLTKIASWDSTLSLFENEYAVPLLPPEVAALLGTGVELFFPVLLVLGLGTRAAALVLFVFNIVAVVSYPDLGAAGLKDHQTWGLLLLVTLTHGPGALSLDRLIHRRLGHGPRG
ncbi:DoxX family protein [Azohydromonas lata]|uniref:DoxX family protein n=1 Tax=Azohydromonas lata TaxID=45677 RepID=UPI000A4A8E48|nr:DoxX family protein [Azohydromonas lata]